MNGYLVAASAASFSTFAIHTWIGGPITVPPLLNSKDMHDVPKYTNYYCWHLVTVTLFVMGLAFAWGASHAGGADVAWFAFLLATSFLLWNLVLIVWKQQNFMQMLQWLLFAIISGLALFGLL